MEDGEIADLSVILMGYVSNEQFDARANDLALK